MTPAQSRRSKDVLSSRVKTPPAVVTWAESYYYQKQIDGETLMVAALADGGEIRGRLIWYDRARLGFLLHDGTQVMVAKKVLKYLWKQEDAGRKRRVMVRRTGDWR